MKKTFGIDIKIILVGNPNTGKTCFVNKWTKNQFTDKYKATIMSEFGYKIIDHNETIYRIQLWDIAGT
jgi:small GTP-binding protein